MQRSFYCKIIFMIGFFAGLELVLKYGFHRMIIPLIIDAILTIIVMILVHFAMHNQPKSNQAISASNYQQPASVNPSPTGKQLTWQQKHDAWWRREKQIETHGGVFHQVMRSKTESANRNVINLKNRKARLAIQGSNSNETLDQEINHAEKRLKQLQKRL